MPCPYMVKTLYKFSQGWKADDFETFYAVLETQTPNNFV